MTHEEKVALFLATMAQDRARTTAPLPWLLLWKLRIKIPPPEFMNPLLVFTILLLFLAFFFVVCTPVIVMVFAGWTLSEVGAIAAPFLSLMLPISVFGAGFAAFFADARARKHGFGSWDEFGNSAVIPTPHRSHGSP